ncbi:rhomboid family intramembrane serine protease [Bacillus ginsengihumi]|uniref:Rhomboid family intramembrane serine protease n=1 Tax=Heyndrickxia ginsengihumi TaxID=363870 RepID=A0A6M0P9Y9_9BACI|nr:rhomboid family intramembrane serine protease [Bacillus sp. (in: firmicutes)]NEY21616.1 rhomboid family intramembrane serine protease [Heyndrickxia ginsengihumi]
MKGGILLFIRSKNISTFLKDYPITASIIIIQSLLFFITFIPYLPHDFIFQYFAGVNLYIARGELWRLITPIFVHRNFSHLLWNSCSIILLGPFLENILGKWKFTFVYIGCGLFANIASYLFLPRTYIHVGASGAIFGLLGMYFMILIFSKGSLPAIYQKTILTVVLLSIVITFLQPGTNVVAHLFGLIIGVLLGWWLFNKKGLKPY